MSYRYPEYAVLSLCVLDSQFLGKPMDSAVLSRIVGKSLLDFATEYTSPERIRDLSRIKTRVAHLRRICQTKFDIATYDLCNLVMKPPAFVLLWVSA